MTGRGTWTAIAGAAGAIVLVAGTFVMIRMHDRSSTLGLQAGDCVRYDSAGSPDKGWTKTACSEAASTWKVVGFALTTEAKPCRELPGAERTFTADDRVVCLGSPGVVDPATAINVARPGDCVIMPNVRDAFRHNCADAAAQYQVLQRLEEVPRNAPGGACGAVAGTVQVYAINWESTDPIAQAGRNLNPGQQDKQVDDVVLCLGANPRVAAAASSAAASRSDCRFLSDADMGSAVSSAAGKQYTVASHAEASLGGCDYKVVGTDEYVSVERRPHGTYDPGTGDQPFSLDGLRAMYGPGEGNRYVTVEVAGGTFTVVVRLAKTGDSFSKNVAVAVFRAARPKIT